MQPRLLIIDPVCAADSPAIKGIIHSIPALREAGFSIEMWGWRLGDGLQVDKFVKFPLWLNLHTISVYFFILAASLRAWFLFTVMGLTRPDIILSVAWHYPFSDVCHVQFSHWDWARRQKELGIQNVRDLFHWAVNHITRMLANFTLAVWPSRLYLPVSDAVAEDLLAVRSDLNIHVLPNSYNPQRFNKEVMASKRSQNRADLGYSDSDSVFLFASIGHYRRKGFYLAVDGVAKLRKTCPGARLLVVGGFESSLNRLRAGLDQSHPEWREWLCFTGMVTDMESYYAAADGLLFPSYSEAFALVEVEAAACGLPLFLTRHHGSEMVMEDGKNGRWIDFDADDIARVLEEYVTKKWVPVPTPLRHAMDAGAYAKRLVTELRSVLPPSMQTDIRVPA